MIDCSQYKVRLKLFGKLGLSYLGLFLFALAGMYFATRSAWERQYLEDAYRSLDSEARIAAARPPERADRDSLATWVRWVSRGGARVTLIAPDGTVLADSDESPAQMENHADRPEVRAAFGAGRGRAARFSTTTRRHFLYLAVRVSWPSTGPLVLRLARPVASVQEALRETHTSLTTISLLTLAVGSLLALAVSRRFARRVGRLREFSQRVAQGDYRPAPVAEVADELGELQTSLNQTVKQLAQALRSVEDERNHAAAILSSMSEGVAVIDDSERILYANPAFRQALQARGDYPLEGRRLVEVTRQREILTMIQEVRNNRARMEAEVTTPGLKPRHFLMRAVPLLDGSTLLVVLDVTELKRLERVRRDFVANVSHELRTPLTAIQGFAETLLRGALEEPENSRRFVEIIREHASRLGRLTEDLLKLSRIEAGKLDLELRPLSVRAIVERSVETARLKAEQKRQAIDIQIPDPGPQAMADAHALVDVLRNLLDNAVQYTAEDGHIRVRVLAGAEDATEIRIAVEDDGIGIPAASRDRIFERFYRVDAARSRMVGGTGLGLSISKHLVEAMGGRIELESQLGKGSTFTVVLPQASADRTAVTAD